MCKIIGVGTDLCTVSRLERAIEKAHFYARVYTENERAYLEQKGKTMPQSAAAMFAAKEAAAKALGTGFAGGVMPASIEVTHDDRGAPGLAFHGAAQERFAALGGRRAHLSLSHEGDTAMAFCVLEG